MALHRLGFGLGEHIELETLQPTDWQDYQVELPEFPLFWLDKEKRNIEGLREIASHLHGKTERLRTSRDGFKGVITEMEKQLINHVVELEQVVGHQDDVLQSLMQIIVTEHERKLSQRIKRVGKRAWVTGMRIANRLWANTFFKLVSTASTVAFVIGAVVWIIHTMNR
jgi:hypothetical protein